MTRCTPSPTKEPPFLAESSTPRAIFFWPMGRTFEVLTMALVAVQWVPAWSRRLWLTIGMAVSFGLIYLGSYHIDAFPVTFVKGQAVTPFKADYEYVLCALNIAVAFQLWRQVVALARDNTYDLILMDMQMPKMDGLDATRQIRAIPGRKTVPVLALTGNAFSEDRQKCLEVGMDDFLTKPMMPDALYATILNWLRRQIVQNQAAEM